ncbi:Uncharacterized protein Adt_14508 [Abeliophyllum distichum]|uniref:Uncharacterized protein n=1 Tax=Abeliophyllum distichum TaxID=126358 RepID=A0ABD1TZT9_9LAMI
MYNGHITPHLESLPEKYQYRLCFGLEAVAPAEVIEPTLRIIVQQANINLRKYELDLLEGVRQKAFAKMVTYKCRIAVYFDRMVKPQECFSGRTSTRQDRSQVGKTVQSYQRSETEDI